MLYEELCMQIEAVFHTEARDEAVVGYSMKNKYPCRTRVTREEW